ncbi:hypothetical protein JM93_01674 [Roseibium hamelinense]|uniref:Uncharacterized protein n=1 Tax=Roseibium hamelinense TaxID=150831 RepID=A0A562T7B1_9HYPH|nr:hypothetical protein [Roseibium hamelinense]MTI42806.1 hypothetical protein [Roseibium hamelinense]TWI89471.1 hypothetical protein JM93_01674 [Roseibium hamelinense]
MAKTIWRTSGGNGFLAGSFQLGFYGETRGSVKQLVHDGDTINVASNTNFPVRFLGIDTPEISFMDPVSGDFKKSDDPIFQELLATPFAEKFGGRLGFSNALCDYIDTKASPNGAVNHHELAEAAEDKLEDLIQSDLTAQGDDRDAFRFFTAFAYDALDFYGRLLCYLHLDQAGVAPADRKPSYNEQLLASGLASPYFIFPNVDPFRAKGSPVDAAFDAGSPQSILSRAPKLRTARQVVKAARDAELGIFNPGSLLLFEAFELRYLARHTPPSRWVIDLSGDDRVLYHPQTYFQIPNPEDRLWVPAEFVPLFETAGWFLGATPNDYA